MAETIEQPMQIKTAEDWRGMVRDGGVSKPTDQF